MENQITEFIALTSYTSERLKGEKKVPLGAVEKMLSISRNILNVSIEYMDTKIFRRGSVNLWQPNFLVVERPPLVLESLESRYYDKETTGDGTAFTYTDRFMNKIDILRTKAYLFQYESTIAELIDIWKTEGGLSNLTFIDMFRNDDGGMSFLIGDLEIIASDIYDYVRKTFYLERPQKPETIERRKQETDKKITDTVGSLKEKIALLKSSGLIKERLGSGIKSILRKNLLARVRTFPPDSILYDLVEGVSSYLLKTWEVIRLLTMEFSRQMKLFPEPGISKSAMLKELESLLISMHELKSCALREKVPADDVLIGTLQKILDEVGLWNRALLGKFDFTYFLAHQRNVMGYESPRSHISFYDIKKSSYILDFLTRNISSPVLRKYHEWFKRITAVPKNWSILFGGKISPKEENAGDKLSAYFDNFSGCMFSTALSMYHLLMLDSISEDPFRFQARAGVGEGDVYFVGDQEHCLLINYLAHAIEKLADLDVDNRQAAPYCLVLESYIKDHSQLNEYRDDRDALVKFKEGKAIPIRLGRCVNEISARLAGVRETAVRTMSD